jgi:hypothetical protein
LETDGTGRWAEVAEVLRYRRGCHQKSGDADQDASAYVEGGA